LGVRAVIAKSYARIHRKNLINFGILPLEFENEKDHEGIDQEDILEIENVHKSVESKEPFEVKNKTKGTSFKVKDSLSDKERKEVLAGGLINVYLAKHKPE